MKVVYCSKCNTPLTVKRVVIKSYGRIIDSIDPHECPDTPLPLTFEKFDNPMIEAKIVQNLNELETPRGVGQIGTDTLMDRRSSEHIKQGTSAAPKNLLEQMKALQNSIPSYPTNEDPNG